MILFCCASELGTLEDLSAIEVILYYYYNYYYYLWIGKDIYNFIKIAAILNFHVNMPPLWILCIFGPF